MSALPRIKSGLREHRLDDQLLVYDTVNERVHLLDPTTACVFSLLQEGGWTREGIREELALRLKATPSDAFVPLAIEELRGAELLESENAPSPLGEMGRRERLRKVAIGGVTALPVPTIATLTANSASAATALAACAPCTANSQCQSSRCLDAKQGAGSFCNVSSTGLAGSGCLVKDTACSGAQDCLCCNGDCTGNGATQTGGTKCN